MAISFVGQAGGSPASASLSGVSLAAGDFIIVFAYKNSIIAPTIGSGYTQIATGSSNSNSFIIGYKVSTGSETTTGTWANASAVNVAVYRGVSRIGASASSTKAASTTATIPAITLQRQDSNSWVVALAGSRQSTSQGTPLAGATQSRGTQTGSTADTIIADTNGAVNTFSATTSANGSSVVSCGATVELIAIGAKLDTFIDALTAGTLNGSNWNSFTGGSATLTYGGSGVTVTFPSSSTSSTDGDISTVSIYDLTSSAGYLHVTQIASSSTSADCSFTMTATSGNVVAWQTEAGTLFAQHIIGGSQTNLFSVAYNSTTHAWWRIRESGGTTFWDTSADGSTWTNRFSESNAITLTGLTVDIAGTCFQAETNPGTFKFVSFNTSGATASVTQVAANLTATGGTQSVVSVSSGAITQSNATLTATGGTQSVSAVVVASASITQVAANLTVTGGTQTITTINDVAITQVAAHLTTTGGTQSISTVNFVSVSQIAANVTAAGGTQGVQNVQDVQISQIAGTLTTSGGTQSVSTVNIVAISQSAANLTATGGTQSVSSGAFVNASVTQIAASLTASGGTQTVATVNIVSIPQVAATLTATGGTQAITTVNISSITQVAANVLTTGGTQTVSSTSISSTSITQVGASLTATGGTQSVATVQDTSISQVGANLTTTGGTQAIATIGDVSITQTAASITASGGTQTINTSNFVSISQTAGSITATGGTQLVYVNANVIQMGANLTVTGGSQGISSATGVVNVSIGQVGASLTLTGGSPVITTSTGPLPTKKYYIDSDANIYWVINQSLGLVEKV